MLTVAQRLAMSFTHLYCGQGDWVWLKKFETGAIHHLRQSSTSILRKVRTVAAWVCGEKVVWGGGFVMERSFYSLCLPFISVESYCMTVNNSRLVKSIGMESVGLHLTNMTMASEWQ